MVPVFSGHTGVTNVELLIYFFLWGEGTISVIYWETHFILLFVRVGIFLGGDGVGYRGWDIWQNFRETPPHTQTSPTVQCHQAGGFPS